MRHSIAFYTRIYDLIHLPVRIWLGSKYRLVRTEMPKLPETFILISNHVTNYDPFLTALLTSRHMFFVATEHIFSLGWISRVIDSLAAPIPRPKGGQGTGAVMEILRRVKEGGSVGLFAEGNCSWDGVTGPFPAATGKMVRASGAALVTVRIDGGYFGSPRWAYTSRRGPVGLSVTGIYGPEELKEMKPDQINKLIAEGIRCDAYEAREKTGALYPGRRLAEGIEHALLVCPRCRGFDTLKSKGNGFSCSCGLKGCYDTRGMLTVDGSDFTTMKEWNAWQQAYLRSLPKEQLPAASDSAMKLLKIENHSRTQAAAGDLTMTAEALTIGNLTIPTADIVSLDVRLKGTVSFLTRGGDYYELKKQARKQGYHGRKYQLLYKALPKGVNE